MTEDHKKAKAAEQQEHGSAAPEKVGNVKNKHDDKKAEKTASEKTGAEIITEMHDEIVRERDEYLDSLQRLQAEFANFRKRVQREGEQHAQQASIRVIEDLLPVLDNFERAMKAAAEHDEKLLEGGVELVYSQLRDILARRGLCEIKAEGTAFDPNQHEAVLCQPSDTYEEGTVTNVLEKGYQVNDKVVRPAKVIVSASPEEDSGSNST